MGKSCWSVRNKRAAAVGITVIDTSKDNPTAALIAEALAAGADDYLSKPFGDIHHLMSRVRTLVDRRATKLLFDVIVRDLTEVVESGGIDTLGVDDLSRELFASVPAGKTIDSATNSSTDRCRMSLCRHPSRSRYLGIPDVWLSRW